MNTYIHYGHTEFDPAKFVPIANERMFSKPHGGFWASPINAKYGWKQWTSDENFRDCDEANSFIFTLSPTAKVKHIRNYTDLSTLKSIGYTDCPVSSFGTYHIDFEACLADGMDAIEVEISADKHKVENHHLWLYYQLYGWDCDSILILNPDVVVPMEQPEKGTALWYRMTSA